MTQYVLIRILPDGTEKSHSPLSTLREVQGAVAYVLMDNPRVPRGQAMTFAAGFVNRPVGETVKHGTSGYAFRIDRV
jgi:hypothetical protein